MSQIPITGRFEGKPATREVLSVAGGFEEPGSLSAVGRRLYVPIPTAMPSSDRS
jgi:hypothetical protein